MTDVPVVDPVVDPPAEPVVPEPEARVPVKELQAERAKRADLQTRLDALEAENAKREKEGMSELDRLRAERDEAVTAKAAADNQLATVEKQRLMETAAKAAGFTNPALAARLADLATITDELAAKDAVAALVASDPYLVAKPEGSPPDLKRVLKDGTPAGAPSGTPPPVTRDELRTMSTEQIAALDPKVIEAAMTAA